MINYVIRLVDNGNGINLFVKNLYLMFCISIIIIRTYPVSKLIDELHYR